MRVRVRPRCRPLPRVCRGGLLTGKAAHGRGDSLGLGTMMLVTLKQHKPSRSQGLMFTNITVVDKKINALVDTKASDLFTSVETVKMLGLEVKVGVAHIKTVNNKEVPTIGTASNVSIRLGEWVSNESIKVIPFDDYDFVIRLDFLDCITVMVVPFSNCIVVLDPRGQCVVLVRHG
ncbi:Uncharacterized protein TCM_033715 [Theobroma cacao]|uniref:Aspartic peptidase DDI1-type domain-containing protein n=1 Tax=Theobroma cacao TaxID=3641 RepID=A0A061FIL7_THECC|nr:Uncharacterized protein TCM_033715 [Theobroma cacao]